MASLSAVIDRFSAPRFIIPDLKVAAYVSEHLEESTHHLIIPFFLTLASLFLHASLSSRLQLVSLRPIGFYLLHLWHTVTCTY